MLEITGDPTDVDEHLPFFGMAPELEHLGTSTQECERVYVSASAGGIDGEGVDPVGVLPALGGERDEFVLPT